MTFTFDKNYKNHEQVAPFLADFLAVHAEITSAGRYPYDASFLGRIPGLAGSTEKDEKTGIYMLQTLKDLREIDAKIAAYLADGFEHIESVDGVTKFARVVEYGYYMGGTGWQEWTSARLVPQENARQATFTGGIYAVLPKGKRTNGRIVNGKVLAKR